jgi:hypothetical protein
MTHTVNNDVKCNLTSIVAKMGITFLRFHFRVWAASQYIMKQVNKDKSDHISML